MTVVIHSHNDEVIAFLHLISDIEVERREATDMCSYLLAIEIDIRLVVRSAEIEIEQTVLLQVILKGFLIPHTPFVEQQFRSLCIPVARHLQRFLLREVVFHMVAFRLRFLVFEEAVR